MSVPDLVDVPAVGVSGESIPYKKAIYKGGGLPFDGAPGRRLRTPRGDVGISQPGPHLVRVSGPEIADYSLRTSEPLSITEARRGLQGSVGDVSIRVWRPKFGFRFRDRDGYLVCGEMELRAKNLNRDSFEVYDFHAGALLFRKKKYHLSCAPDITAEQLGLSFVLWQSGIMEYSTLLSFLTI